MTRKVSGGGKMTLSSNVLAKTSSDEKIKELVDNAVLYNKITEEKSQHVYNYQKIEQYFVELEELNKKNLQGQKLFDVKRQELFESGNLALSDFFKSFKDAYKNPYKVLNKFFKSISNINSTDPKILSNLMLNSLNDLYKNPSLYGKHRESGSFINLYAALNPEGSFKKWKNNVMNAHKMIIPIGNKCDIESKHCQNSKNYSCYDRIIFIKNILEHFNKKIQKKRFSIKANIMGDDEIIKDILETFWEEICERKNFIEEKNKLPEVEKEYLTEKTHLKEIIKNLNEDRAKIKLKIAQIIDQLEIQFENSADVLKEVKKYLLSKTGTKSQIYLNILQNTFSELGISFIELNKEQNDSINLHKVTPKEMFNNISKKKKKTAEFLDIISS